MSGQTPYQLIGGEAGLKELVKRFYDNMETLPECKPILDLHPKDLSNSRKKTYMFLSGWMGGPDLYIQAFGHPRLRARHLPFPIGPNERDQWLLCMKKALDDMELDPVFKIHLMGSFFNTADHMINQDDQTLIKN